MSTLKALLKDVPVEWKKLWEVTIWDKKFNSVQKGKQTKVISHKYLLAAELFELEDSEGSVFLLSTGEKYGFTTIEKAGDYLREGEIVSIPWGKSRPVIDVLKYYKGLYITADNRIATSINTEILLNKYLFYWLQTQADLIDSFYRGSGIKHPSMSDVLDMLIPIPPIDIQQQIVRVLDGLSEQNKALTTALAQEIDQRKKQYAYYREELFRFEGKEVEWKTLGENISKTSNIKWSHTDGNFRYIDLSSVDRDKKFITETTEINAGNAPSRAQKIVLEDDVIFATTRPTQMRVCLITEEFSNQIASTGFCVLRAMKHTVLPKWILYQLTSNSFKNYLEENQAGIAYPAISDAKIKEFKIPIPFPNDKNKSLQEQERIVRLLDQYDEATKSIVAQLQKEIELRNKHYEYYRNLLLSFPKA